VDMTEKEDEMREKIKKTLDTVDEIRSTSKSMKDLEERSQIAKRLR